VTAYTCPKGHPSETGDFCDTCGAKIGDPGSSSPLPPTAVFPTAPLSPPPSAAPVAAPVAAAGKVCPNCGTPQTGTDRFCEGCGYDHSTGRVPAFGPAATAAPVGGSWTATVTADKGYFDANGIDGVEFPAYCPERTFTLPPPQVRIGRRSTSKGTDPEMDLSAQPLDPGISHSHALLTLNTDGVWLVTDLGSTNGTYLNDEAEQLTAGKARPLADGDRVHVGAWTTITVHAPA
jgi:hypothetical protein